MTMLAAALATKPKLVLLDEPIGGLSPPEVKEFVVLVQKINKELGLTIVIIEHLMKVLTKLSNRLMIIENGEKLAIGQGLMSNARLLAVDEPSLGLAPNLREEKLKDEMSCHGLEPRLIKGKPRDKLLTA